MKNEANAQTSQKPLRVASYLDAQTLKTFDNWCKSLGVARAEGLKRIIKNSLNLNDGDNEGALNSSIDRLSKQVERLQRILNEA